MKAYAVHYTCILKKIYILSPLLQHFFSINMQIKSMSVLNKKIWFVYKSYTLK